MTSVRQNMDQRTNIPLTHSKKPSKLLASLALVIAIALPFFLVKWFSPKNKINASGKRLLTPLESTAHLQKDLVFSAADPSKESKLAQRPIKITTLKPSPLRSANSPSLEAVWQIVKTQKGDSFAILFKKLNISSQVLQTIIQDNPDKKSLLVLKPNQTVQFLLKPRIKASSSAKAPPTSKPTLSLPSREEENGQQSGLEKMILSLSETQSLSFTREGEHYKSNLISLKTVSHPRYFIASIYDSLYSTAKRHNIPYKLIQQMTEIFSWDINFAKDVRTGDQFAIMYEALYVGDKQINTGNIIAVTYKNRGKIFQAVRHANSAGDPGYYTPEGASLKKAFARYPLRFSHISSTFSYARNHPILHYKRAHYGIDLAAPIGTPIHATGDGYIELIGRQSGYGNMIKINHNNIYSTVYGHMLKFQKGLSKGDHVKQGQVIGYVGQTGLATGPHCHYEFHINKQPKNPTTINLPRGTPISARELARFKADSQALLARLKRFEDTYYASLKSKEQKTG